MVRLVLIVVTQTGPELRVTRGRRRLHRGRFGQTFGQQSRIFFGFVDDEILERDENSKRVVGG